MSATGIPDVGAHCALERCNVNDFLPIKCRCERLFCREHIQPEEHACPLINETYTPQPGEPAKKMQRCAAEKCNKLSLEAFIAEKDDMQGRTPALCLQCQKAFCASHRDPATHGCVAKPEAEPQRNEAAKAILAKIFPTQTAVSPMSPASSSSVPAKRKAPPSNPKKAAQLRQVELMKMRHKAQAGDPKDKNKSVPIDQKLHVKVRTQEKGEEEKIFWFQKTIIAGRALDMLSPHFGVSSDEMHLYLERFSAEDIDERIRLELDRALADQVEDGAQLVLNR
ncbi:uncharacterized protein PHACADRAFT_121751 [Phanerochaete carnosa HHB-10118-sp]|uniref:AN1-type domain-containing protein n=1 Tax=Phanerochaete carnosa (strain HHB-10118-sp) TaxID=650164 RepID=K5WA50_PHACS|nr:uncharacterized protein PHACADRAFT_121751 [Phanerochaete carnosa HHB-10118-sp]EKM55829.1 hypothetical protein PHACADRAFT_121751 [Phanerochaete carnosa HHB-10118-sp]